MMQQALILVDVIQDFFDQEGSNFHPEYNILLAEIREILSAARKTNTVIVHAQEHHRANHPDFEWKKLPEHCIASTDAVKPAQGIDMEAGDIVIHKRRYSAFFATDLDLTLREREVGRVFSGRSQDT